MVPALCRGLEHLGEQAWLRHLAEECVFLNSLLFGAGLPPHSPRLALCRGVCGASLPLHCCLCSAQQGGVRQGGPAVTPKGTPSQVSGSAASFSSRHGAAVQVNNIWH